MSAWGRQIQWKVKYLKTLVICGDTSVPDKFPRSFPASGPGLKIKIKIVDQV
jgi:hypothetical protein